MRELGAELVAICPQIREKNAGVKKKLRLGFPILSDPGNEYARALGLAFELPDELKTLYTKFGINLPESNGDESYQLPIPARIVVDRDGVMRDFDADVDYTRRPEPDATLAILRSLN